MGIKYTPRLGLDPRQIKERYMDFRTLIRNYLIAKSITLQDFASTIGLSYSQAYALVYLDSKISLEDITGISQAYPELKNENSAAPKPSIKTIVEKNLLDYKGLLEHQKEDISISLNSMEKTLSLIDQSELSEVEYAVLLDKLNNIRMAPK
jgi:hypothetical protein